MINSPVDPDCLINEGMVLQSVEAKGTVSGLLLEMNICQNYKNITNKNIEVSYTFPLPWDATLIKVDIDLQGKQLTGIVLEKQTASKRYENAILDGNTPIMLEKNSEGLYTVNLGNLKPGEEVAFKYRYAQLLKFVDSSIRIGVPTVIAPRYGDSSKGGIKKHQSVSSNFLIEYPFTLSLVLDGGLEKATIECPSHQIQVTKLDEKIRIDLSRGAYLDRDFVLNLSQLSNQTFCVATPDKNLGEEGCTLLASFYVPAPKKLPLKPVNLKILVDCSGSMDGDSIDSAKRALHHVLSHLDEKDSFSYTVFGSSVNHYFKTLRIADPLNISATSALISNTKANMGGTETAQAIISTIDIDSGGQPSDILLITDGEVWDTDEITRIAQKSNHRIFALGVGSAPADSFLQELADKTGGSCELVSPKENIEASILRLFNQIKLPRSINVSLKWKDDEKPLWISGNNRPVFFNTSIHVLAGLSTIPKTPPTLTFFWDDSYAGEKLFESKTIQAGNVYIDRNNGSLNQIGAKNRIKNSSKNDQILLALRYQLITEETNFLLVHIRDEKDKISELPDLQQIKQMYSAGYGGAGSVHETVYLSKKMEPQLIWRSAPGRVIDSVQSTQFDVPKLFRVSRDVPINLTDTSKENLNKEDFYYEIPAFLRKKEARIPPHRKPLSPEEIIAIANAEIKKEEDLITFIKVMNEKAQDEFLKNIINRLASQFDQKEIWTLVLSWLYLNFENQFKWDQRTVVSIKKLASATRKNKFNSGLSTLMSSPGIRTIHSWL